MVIGSLHAIISHKRFDSRSRKGAGTASECLCGIGPVVIAGRRRLPAFPTERVLAEFAAWIAARWPCGPETMKIGSVLVMASCKSSGKVINLLPSGRGLARERVGCATGTPKIEHALRRTLLPWRVRVYNKRVGAVPARARTRFALLKTHKHGLAVRGNIWQSFCTSCVRGRARSAISPTRSDANSAAANLNRDMGGVLGTAAGSGVRTVRVRAQSETIQHM